MQEDLEKGLSLYLTVMILAVILVLALGTATLFSSQTRMLHNIGNSVPAVYAAETGIERSLLMKWPTGTYVGPDNDPEATLENGATYQLWVLAPGDNCPGLNYCVKSIGTYRDVRRGIRIIR